MKFKSSIVHLDLRELEGEMDIAYEEHEKACKEIRNENAKLLEDFEQWLVKKNLSEKVKRNHVSNVDFYINDFLLYEEAVPAKEGFQEISSFLGYWFIKKTLWSSVSAIRGNAASLKKFYAFMLERGQIQKDDYGDLCDEIKTGMPEWLAIMERYDDPDITDPEEIWDL